MTYLKSASVIIFVSMGANTQAEIRLATNDSFAVVVQHEKNGELRDTGYSELGCHTRIATIIARVAIPTRKPYKYNGSDAGWGYDDYGRFEIQCVRE